MWEDVSTSAARFGAPALTVSAIITLSCIDETFSFRSARDSCHSEARSAEEPAVHAAPRTPPPSPRPTPTLLPHLPERTHPKPGKGHGEANCNHHAPQSSTTRLVLRILFSRSESATRRHHQKNQPRNLKPQLMQHAPERPGGRRNCLRHGPCRPAALDLLPGHARHYPQLSCRRNLAHGLDFNSLRRYNGASLRTPSKSFSGRGHLTTSGYFRSPGRRRYRGTKWTSNSSS
jgi:hypothetical protein